MTAAEPDETLETIELHVEERKPIAFLVAVDDDEGVTLKVQAPKKAWFLKWGGILQSDNPLAMVGAVDAFLAECFDAKDAAYIQGRLDDRADSFDVDDLEPILEKLTELVVPNRPTGRPGGSAQRRQRSGTSSTVRSSGKGKTRKR